MTRELRDMLARAAGYTMTPEEKRAQAVSFAYGNAVLANPSVTREMVERVYDEREADEQRESAEGGE